MKTPPIPKDENNRMDALSGLDILYSPSEERFDRITRLAKRLFDVPIALISLVSSDKQWFKSCQGLGATETPREISFCGHAILQDDTFVVPNALKDPDFRDNPLVTDEPKIRFYAGKPLLFDNHRMGTLCIIDKRPRHLKPQEYDSLKCLAGWVELELLSWSRNKSPLIQQFLELNDREQLFDSTTGDLNSAGIKQLKEKLLAAEAGTGLGFQITASISELPENLPQEARELAYKTLGQCLRMVVADRGIVGRNDEEECVLILENSDKEEAKEIIEEIGAQFVDILQQESGLDMTKPKVRMELKSL